MRLMIVAAAALTLGCTGLANMSPTDCDRLADAAEVAKELAERTGMEELRCAPGDENCEAWFEITKPLGPIGCRIVVHAAKQSQEP